MGQRQAGVNSVYELNILKSDISEAILLIVHEAHCGISVHTDA